MTTKVKMLPSLNTVNGSGEGGINTLVRKYHKYMPAFGFEFTESDDCDLLVVHAGTTDKILPVPIVSMIHGLYWGDDIPLSFRKANANIVNVLRHAAEITVPSDWVAETIRRDLRINPHIVPHGVDWESWQHGYEHGSYVLWNKNTSNKVCNPQIVNDMARRFPDKLFMTTYSGESRASKNIKVIGPLPHSEMKIAVQQAAVYLSTTKETFGIGILEAMAAGVPVLGWKNGGNLELVKHGVNGYLAQQGNYDDFARGLDYCFDNRETLGANGRELAKRYTWESACEIVAGVWRKAMEPKPATVSVIIPVFNKPIESVKRAIDSVVTQTLKPEKVVVIDDGSEIELSDLVKNHILSLDNPSVQFIRQHNQGVSAARNRGISEVSSKYVSCLDSDDRQDPQFLRLCVEALESDRTLGIAYTGLMTHKAGKSELSQWPPAIPDYDRQVHYTKRQNQIPTCCVFRREIWARTGGYRSRFEVNGAGSEDAAFWPRSMALGYGAKCVTREGLFHHSREGQVSTNRQYSEPDWLAFYPWSRDNLHPFCSVSTPKDSQLSHTVKYYDEPLLSIIIPVGPGHENDVFMAIDSIEAQSFRDWEIVIINDTGGNIDDALKPYPFVIKIDTPGKMGAGYARNRGAEAARGRLLLFNDADDFINIGWDKKTASYYNQTLEAMVQACVERGDGIYTNYIGRCFPNNVEDLDISIRSNIINETDKGEVFYKSNLPEYDRDRAIVEPVANKSPYVWNLVNTMIHRQWHLDIGGFDEDMVALEDWDYWLRLARDGKCFSMIPGEHFIYRFYSGQRREAIEGNYPALFEHMVSKYNDEDIKMCGCKNKKNNNQAPFVRRKSIKRQPVPRLGQEVARVTNRNGGKVSMRGEWIEVNYISTKRALHMVKGATTGVKYGRHANGHKFNIWSADLGKSPNRGSRFELARKEMVIEEPAPEMVAPPQMIKEMEAVARPESLESTLKDLLGTALWPKSETANSNKLTPGMVAPPPPIEPKTKTANWEDSGNESGADSGDTFESVDVLSGNKSHYQSGHKLAESLTSIKGVNEALAQAIISAGLDTKEAILMGGDGALNAINGVGKAKAKAILEHIKGL